MSYPALENFIERVKLLNASGSTQMRLTKEEAQTMTVELTELLLKRPTEKIIVTRPSDTIVADGGKF